MSEGEPHAFTTNRPEPKRDWCPKFRPSWPRLHPREFTNAFWAQRYDPCHRVRHVHRRSSEVGHTRQECLGCFDGGFGVTRRQHVREPGPQGRRRVKKVVDRVERAVPL